MPPLAIFTGLALALLGLVFYFLGAPGERSVTALIPTFLGLLILGAGLAARQPARRKQAMHIAAGFGLLGFLGSLRGAPGWGALLSGNSASLERPLATTEQLILFLICATFLALCVRSFIAARRSV